MRLPSRPRQARSLSAENQYFLLAYAFLAFLSVFELYQTALADDLPSPRGPGAATRYSESRSAELGRDRPSRRAAGGKTAARNAGQPPGGGVLPSRNPQRV